MMRWLSWLATTLVLFSGGVVFWQATDGFAAFTTETARRLEIARSPRPLPTAALLDPHGSEIRARDLAGRVLIVDFIYTACPAVCSQLGGTFGTLQRELNDELRHDRVKLLSVAFDLERDTPAALAHYRRSHRAGTDWIVARTPSEQARAAWLRAFGVIAIPDGLGGFTHNATLNVVDARGRLVAVFDVEQWPAALELARTLAQRELPFHALALR